MITATWNIALAHEPSPGFFKGTCLFDPIDPETPKRMQALVREKSGTDCGAKNPRDSRGGNPFHDQLG